MTATASVPPPKPQFQEFKRGMRKKLIQNLENSFVIMDRNKKTTKSPVCIAEQQQQATTSESDEESKCTSDNSDVVECSSSSSSSTQRDAKTKPAAVQCGKFYCKICCKQFPNNGEFILLL